VETAVVTGAGRGLGRALARRLADRGLTVLATDIDQRAVEDTATEIGGDAAAARLDVRDPAACRAIATQARGLGRLAVWINNAGVVRTERIWEHADEAVELIVATNLLGVMHGSRAAIEAMREEGGRILNIASLSSLGPAPGLAVYGAAKHGVLSFSLSLQAELRDAGVPVEARSICPDAIETDMIRERAGDPESALIWSGPRVLTADEVAYRAIEVLYGRPLLMVVPRWRGAVARAIDLAPRAGVTLLPLFKRLGERNRRRWAKTADY
jgi:NAD(P)-dependent dehydrogenase (short-subunit alcohol dehydrogenase family)